MKRADTILRKIDELIMNYTDSEIIQAYEKYIIKKDFINLLIV